MVVCGDPLDTAGARRRARALRQAVEVTVAPPEVVIDAINRVYERQDSDERAREQRRGRRRRRPGRHPRLDDEAPIIRWVNSLFFQAVKERASDIHIEPDEKEVLVRYRIDGELYVAERASRQFMSSIIARVKIMAGLNIAEKRLPQDGRISRKIAGKASTSASRPSRRAAYERIVMRLLHKTNVLLDLPDLGFGERDYRADGSADPAARRHHPGHRPDRRGKTTTLYACLEPDQPPELNILTVEDPVEYELDGIHQVHVNPKIGLTFASALRAFLRQDPDVIMVGEIRDKETAEIAIHASLTGHLVLSTHPHQRRRRRRHAPGRHGDRAVPRALVASIGILAQRLVRVLCPHCKEPYAATPLRARSSSASTPSARASRRAQVAGYLAALSAVARRDYEPGGLAAVTGMPTFYRAEGCDACDNKGFMGRRGIYELLIVDDAVGALILKNADAQTIKRAAQRRRAWTRCATTARARCCWASPRSKRSSRRRRTTWSTNELESRALMAVFEYRGIRVATGKAVKGVRDADNPKALRALLRREGMLLTLATRGERAARRRPKREIRSARRSS